MVTRRSFIQTGLLGAGAASLLPQLALAESPTNRPPTRFIFLHKGNGLLPETLVPPTMDAKTRELDKRKQPLEMDLEGHDLPSWMAPLAEHRENLTILQGLSGKMCTTGHHTWCSSLGAFKANERLSSIKWATVDFELARMFPSPFGHIELACFPGGGGNSRGNINGIEKGFSARGPQQPNYAFGSPRIAIQELFKSVSTDRQSKASYSLEQQMLRFVAENQARIARELKGPERPKVGNYANALADIRSRDARVESMADVIRKNLPRLDKRYLGEDLSTVDRQAGHTEILLSALISGMTNVMTFTLDELGTRYTGLPGIEGENVNQHDVGHGKAVTRFSALQVREKIRQQHMRVIDQIVRRLKSVPEGNGTVFDHTMLFYFPDNGETHHSHGTEWPFVVLAGNQTPLDLGRRYIRLPGYAQPGHKTLGNWYTTLLNAFGNPVEHYGAMDVGLAMDQKGPIQSLLG
ncbi:MAG: DUF1552 domain-containing protein [Planctomycetota bacterium]|nr:DUF1552 domain-containing protein [Planctomycetota bacterium]